VTGDPAVTLRADCGSCAGLCCVALPFARSADFAIDKPGGVPCPNLGDGFGCGIHDRLRPSGFGGCAVYDCQGAGQRTVQVTFGGRDWRVEPALARPMFAAFTTMRRLHELLWYLHAAAAIATAAGRDRLVADIKDLDRKIDDLATQDATELATIDLDALRNRTNELLRVASKAARGAGAGGEQAGADLAGADLLGADLRTRDLRRADLRGARLAGALFLTRAQLTAARGDASTTVPTGLERPPHWS
jgi:uncharacterized protein YjbI with pentapeptide repeats